MSTKNSEHAKNHPEWRWTEPGNHTCYYEYTKTIDTFHSSGDGEVLDKANEREYRLILLPNGIQVMLVHDPKCEQAAASLCVGVGYLDDPVSTQRFLLFHGS
jgi:hypothetical protein